MDYSWKLFDERFSASVTLVKTDFNAEAAKTAADAAEANYLAAQHDADSAQKSTAAAQAAFVTAAKTTVDTKNALDDANAKVTGLTGRDLRLHRRSGRQPVTDRSPCGDIRPEWRPP